MRWLVLGLCVAACGARGATVQHHYKIPEDVSLLVVDEDAFAGLAGPLRRDLEADLAHGVAEPKDVLFILAMLDALDGAWPQALARLDRIRELETELRAKTMTGLTIRIWADAIGHEGDHPDGFRAAMERIVATLPLDLVRDDLSMLRAMGQAFTPEECRRLVKESVGPQVKAGQLGVPEMHALVFMRYAVVRLSPVGNIIDSVLEANRIPVKSE